VLKKNTTRGEEKTLAPNYLRASFITLNTGVIQHDIFRLAPTFGGAKYIVSEAFKEAVQQAGLTGMLFVPFEGKQS
jgi:hypothetical protein